MDAEKLIFFALAGLALLIRWLARRPKRIEESATSVAPTREKLKRIPTASLRDTDEEKVRRLMEALGQPLSAAPPRKVQPRPVLPHVLPFASPLPPLVTRPPEAEVALPEVAKSVSSALELPPRETAPMSVPLSQKARKIGFGQSASAVARAGTGITPAREIARALRTPEGLRQAMILREVFDLPRSLQGADDLRSF